MISQRLAAPTGYAGDKFNLNKLRRIEFNDRLYGAELLRDQLVAFCTANPMLTGSGGPVDVSEACPVLDAYDEKVNLDSAGAVLFRRFMSQLGVAAVHDPVRRRRPDQHPGRARHLRPGGRRGARRRGHRPARREHPARRRRSATSST